MCYDGYMGRLRGICAVIVTGVGRGPLECYDDNSGRQKSTRVCDGNRCRLRVNRVATINVTITQQITLYLLDQYYVHQSPKRQKTTGIFGILV